jgi:hypothetical protein
MIVSRLSLDRRVPSPKRRRVSAFQGSLWKVMPFISEKRHNYLKIPSFPAEMNSTKTPASCQAQASPKASHA